MSVVVAAAICHLPMLVQRSTSGYSQRTARSRGPLRAKRHSEIAPLIIWVEDTASTACSLPLCGNAPRPRLMNNGRVGGDASAMSVCHAKGSTHRSERPRKELMVVAIIQRLAVRPACGAAAAAKKGEGRLGLCSSRTIALARIRRCRHPIPTDASPQEGLPFLHALPDGPAKPDARSESAGCSAASVKPPTWRPARR